MKEMSSCSDGCDETVTCDKCGKQLCKLDEIKHDTVIKKHCMNVGCYRLGDETICMECYSSERGRPLPSTVSQVFSSH